MLVDISKSGFNKAIEDVMACLQISYVWLKIKKDLSCHNCKVVLTDFFTLKRKQDGALRPTNNRHYSLANHILRNAQTKSPKPISFCRKFKLSRNFAIYSVKAQASYPSL